MPACYWCGGPLSKPQTPGAPPSKFCCADHRAAWHREQRKRGRKLLNLYFETRYNRKGQYGISDMNSIVAYWHKCDERNGRVSHDASLIGVLPKDVS